ncbi:MAG: hypothetical protein WC979_02070 [Candidatus Pacearchaeota archaeon]|jgi:hypothetical protein|nr:hypothetical protein [Clostridia bacterium]
MVIVVPQLFANNKQDEHEEPCENVKQNAKIDKKNKFVDLIRYDSYDTFFAENLK